MQHAAITGDPPMRLLNDLRARLFGSIDDDGSSAYEQSAPVADFSDAVSARQEGAASQLLDDERLRGDLTDDEYQPLLDWALAATDRAAAATADLDDEAASAAIDVSVSAVKATVLLVGEAVAAHANGEPDRCRAALTELASDLAATGIGHEATAAQLTELADGLDGRPDLIAADLAIEIAAMLEPAPASATPDPASATPDTEEASL